MDGQAELEERGPIAGDDDYLQVQGLLSRRSAAPAVLRAVMRLFESYRASRKYGWSRPWNKGGLRTFLALEFSPRADTAYVELLRRWVALAGTAVRAGVREGPSREPAGAGGGRSELLADLCERPSVRGFAFLHERSDGEGEFEGFTLGLGAVSSLGKRFRDRLDVVVERAAGTDIDDETPQVTVRLYEDPFVPFQGAAVFPAPCAVTFSGEGEVLRCLVADSLHVLRADALDTKRHWMHWTQDVIDAFGPRRSSAPGGWFGPRALADARALHGSPRNPATPTSPSHRGDGKTQSECGSTKVS